VTELIHSEPESEVAGEVEPQVSAGQMLTEAREARGLSVPEVAAQLRLSVRQVEALEADDYDKLPGITFLRGFVRNYAKLLQVDPAPLLAACPSAQPEAPPIAAPSRDIEFGAVNASRQLLGPLPGASARFLSKYVVAAVVVVVVAPLVLYLALRSDSHPVAENRSAEGVPVPLPLPPADQKPAAGPVVAEVPATAALPASVPQSGAQPAEGPVAATPPAAAGVVPPAPAPASAVQAPAAAAPATSAAKAAPTPAAVAGQGRIKMVFRGQSWVEVRDKSGKVVFSGLNQAGTEQAVSGTPPFSLVVGNARMVTVTYNDKPVDLGPHTPVDVARLTLE
jgi:cytoskeleton protein RodZ